MAAQPAGMKSSSSKLNGSFGKLRSWQDKSGTTFKSELFEWPRVVLAGIPVGVFHDRSDIRQRPLQTARFIPRRPHPGVSLFVCGLDHRHGLGMDRLDDGVRCRGQEPINQMRALNGVSTWCPCRPFSSVQMSANANNGRFEFDRCEPFVPLCRKILDLLEFQDCWFAFSDDCRPLALLG